MNVFFRMISVIGKYLPTGVSMTLFFFLGVGSLFSGEAPNTLSQGTKAGERKTVSVDGVEYSFRWCPSGSFVMGSPLTEKDRFPDEVQHEVRLSKGFWILETEVTQKMYETLTGKNPSAFSYIKFYKPDRDSREWENCPVETIDWNEAMQYCKLLSNKLPYKNIVVNLPTEAEWEYACRAGSQDSFAGEVNALAWTRFNSRRVSPVGKKQANAWGIYDMHGNVMEWCRDWVGPYSPNPTTDPTGPETGIFRMIRGGGWHHVPSYARSAFRYDAWYPTDKHSALGFRVVIEYK